MTRCTVERLMRTLGLRKARDTRPVLPDYTERLAEAGIELSVSSVGDSFDNAMVVSINGRTRPT